MYRIDHVTILEKFRRVMAAGEDNSWDTEVSLLDTLTGAFAGNDKTRTGTAFHALVEHGKPEHIVTANDVTYHLSCGHAFREEQAAEAYKYKAAHPNMFCEIPVSKVYHTPYGSFLLSGRVDGIEGVQVRDTKTKYSTPSAQDYLDSYQWRFYLDMLGLKVFYYDVFEVKSFPKDGLGSPQLFEIDGKQEYFTPLDGLRIMPPQEVSCYAYPTMQRDLNELITAFAEWINVRNYWHLLTPYHDGTTTTATKASQQIAGATATTSTGTTTGAEAKATGAAETIQAS